MPKLWQPTVVGKAGAALPEDVVSSHCKAMLYTVAALAALAGTRYQVPMAAPPADGLPNPNAGKVNDKIEHFVVLMMENRTPDHFFACMGLPKGDWVKEGHVIPMDPKDPSKGGATIKCGEAEYACKSGPGYDMFAGKVEPGGEDNFYPYGAQSDDNSYAHGAHGTSIQLFGKDALPVKKKIAEVFSIFNNYHSAVPSFSMPNHIWAQSATSAGINDNIDYIECGGIDPLFPQRTIYDNLAEAGVSFGLYWNSTPPDAYMAGVLRHAENNFKTSRTFFKEAAEGTLPKFSYIVSGSDPRNGHPNDDHPCHDVALGERNVKDHYEALRAGPGWNKTLFLVTYDDAGGWYG